MGLASTGVILGGTTGEGWSLDGSRVEDPDPEEDDWSRSLISVSLRGRTSGISVGSFSALPL